MTKINKTEKTEKIAISEIEKAEQLLRQRDEEKFAEYLTKLKNLDEEYGFELYVPAIPQLIRVRKRNNA